MANTITIGRLTFTSPSQLTEARNGNVKTWRYCRREISQYNFDGKDQGNNQRLVSNNLLVIKYY